MGLGFPFISMSTKNNSLSVNHTNKKLALTSKSGQKIPVVVQSSRLSSFDINRIEKKEYKTKQDFTDLGLYYLSNQDKQLALSFLKNGYSKEIIHLNYNLSTEQQYQ